MNFPDRDSFCAWIPARLGEKAGTSVWLLVRVAFACLASHPVVAQTSSPSRGDADAVTKADYIAIAKARLGTLVPAGKQFEPARIDTWLAGWRGLILDCEKAKSPDKEMQFIAAEYRASAVELVDSLLAFQALPRAPGAAQQALEGAATAIFSPSQVISGGKEYANRNSALLQTQKRFAQAHQRAQANDLLMPRVAARFSGPPAEENRAWLRIGIFEPRYRFGRTDGVRLTNGSHKTLNNCTVIVRLTGQTGEVAENVHFLESWKPDTDVTGLYSAGDELAGIRNVGRQTVKGIQSVTASVFSDEMHITGVTQIYTQEARRENALLEINGGFKPKSSYRPYTKGLVFDDQRAVFVSYEGLDRLPKVTLTVKCFQDGAQMFDARSITVENWRPNDPKTFVFPSQAVSEADRWDISFRFEDIDHTQTRTWNRNR